MKVIKIIFLLLISIANTNCEKATTTLDNSNFHYPYHITNVICKGIKSGDIKYLFDNNVNTGVLLKSGYYDELIIKLEKPIFLNEIIVNCNNTLFKEDKIDSNDLAKYISISLFFEDNTSICDNSIFKIDYHNGILINTQKNFEYNNLLKIQEIVFDIIKDDKTETTDLDKKIVITEIKILSNDEISYKPNISFYDFLTKYTTKNSEKKSISLNRPNNFFENEKGALKDLIYYALINQKVAEELLMKSNVTQTDISEAKTEFERWYLFTKENLQ